MRSVGLGKKKPNPPPEAEVWPTFCRRKTVAVTRGFCFLGGHERTFFVSRKNVGGPSSEREETSETTNYWGVGRRPRVFGEIEERRFGVVYRGDVKKRACVWNDCVKWRKFYQKWSKRTGMALISKTQNECLCFREQIFQEFYLNGTDTFRSLFC